MATIQTTLNNKKILIVDVPEGAEKFICDMGYLIYDIPDYEGGGWVTDAEIEADAIRFLTTGKSKFTSYEPKPMYQKSGNPLPPGAWSIVGPGLCSEVTEEEAGRLVEGETKVELVDANASGGGRIRYTLYMDYEHGECDFDTAIESLYSFIRSNGKEPSKCVLLINQNETPQTTTK